MKKLFFSSIAVFIVGLAYSAPPEVTNVEQFKKSKDQVTLVIQPAQNICIIPGATAVIPDVPDAVSVVTKSTHPAAIAPNDAATKPNMLGGAVLTTDDKAANSENMANLNKNKKDVVAKNTTQAGGTDIATDYTAVNTDNNIQPVTKEKDVDIVPLK